MSNNIEEQFTPVNGPAKMERKYIQDTVPGNESMFSSLRLTTDGTFATLIAISRTDILSVESLQESIDLEIRNMKVHFDNNSFEYSDVCALVNGRCSSNSILDVIEYNAYNIDTVHLTWHYSDDGASPLFSNLGNVKLQNYSSIVESAGAIQLYYCLKTDKTKADVWLESFLTLLSNQSTSLQVSKSVTQCHTSGLLLMT